jgi:hypothetical protein
LETQDSENALRIDTLKQRLIDFSKIVFKDVQKAHYEFLGQFVYTKYHFSDFVQVAFLDVLETQNEFEWPLDTLKHRLIDFNKVVF